MKEKNFPNNNNLKTLDELTNEVNQIIENLEKEKNLENSIEDYQKLIKLNNIIEKKFPESSEFVLIIIVRSLNFSFCKSVKTRSFLKLIFFLTVS